METRADDNCFSSADEACNSMPYELSHSIPGLPWWVFENRHDNELQSFLRYFCPDSRNEEIKEKIGNFLQHLGYLYCYFDTLIQFWSPVSIASKICLTTADHSFAVSGLHQGLFSYRKHCLEKRILINPADGYELSGEQHYLSPPGWVFRHGLPEYFDNISSSPVTEYFKPALQLGLESYAALPLFEYGKQDCICVLEILSKMPFGFLEDFGVHYSSALKWMNMRSGIESTCDGNIHAYGNRLKYSRSLVAYALPLMQDISVKHQLPLVQMWFASRDGKSTNKILRVSKEIIGCEGVEKSIVWNAFSLRGACFHKGAVSLRRKQYGCFAICLQSTGGDEFHILEFLFPSCGIDNGDAIRTFVTKLVGDLKIRIGEPKSSPFENLDETLRVYIPEESKMMLLNVLHPLVGGTYDEMRSGTIEKIVPPDVILRPELQNSRDMIQGETQGEAPIEPSTLINEENIVTGVQSASIRVEGNTLDVQYGITREVLQQYQGMKLQDAANKLGVSRSTLKRIRKKYGIKRWHHQGSKKTSSHQDAFDSPNKNTDAHNRPKTTMMKDGSSITVKATDGECTWKFQLLHLATKNDWEQQLEKRLNSPMKSFKIQYLDEENERISISCDEDLELCINTCRSQGNTTIRMEVKK